MAKITGRPRFPCKSCHPWIFFKPHKDKTAFEHIERIINTAGYNYWLTCEKCLAVCPNNKKRGEKRNS